MYLDILGYRLLQEHAIDGMERGKYDFVSGIPCTQSMQCLIHYNLWQFCSQSSDSTKSLNLPISYRLLKAVVDYIYTDETPDIHGKEVTV